MKQLALREEAAIDIFEAALHYEREQKGLGYRFESALNDAIRRVAEGPLQFPVLEGDVRRALLRTFPYGILFVVEEDVVTVLAVLHLHRHPDTWKKRR